MRHLLLRAGELAGDPQSAVWRQPPNPNPSPPHSPSVDPPDTEHPAGNLPNICSRVSLGENGKSQLDTAGCHGEGWPPGPGSRLEPLQPTHTPGRTHGITLRAVQPLLLLLLY